MLLCVAVALVWVFVIMCCLCFYIYVDSVLSLLWCCLWFSIGFSYVDRSVLVAVLFFVSLPFKPPSCSYLFDCGCLPLCVYAIYYCVVVVVFYLFFCMCECVFYVFGELLLLLFCLRWFCGLMSIAFYCGWCVLFCSLVYNLFIIITRCVDCFI